MCTRYEVLLEEIELKRKMMIQAANQKGFTNEETIRWSHELDELIFKYQHERIQTKKKRLPLKMERVVYNFA